MPHVRKQIYELLSAFETRTNGAADSSVTCHFSLKKEELEGSGRGKRSSGPSFRLEAGDYS
jgi:hypothetical protein